jgi:sarcosine oxidase subunit beta
VRLALRAPTSGARRASSVWKSKARFRLETDRDLVIESDALVNAAGAWGIEVAQAFSETAPLLAAGPPQFVTEPLPYFIKRSVQAVDGMIIFRQIPRGNVIVAGYPRGTSNPARDGAPVNPARTLTHMRRLIETVPRLAGASLIRVWSGIEGYLPDLLPIIGKSRTTPGLFHAFGFCGHGFQLGPGVGLVLSELIADGSTRTPLQDFDIARFGGAVAADERFKREFGWAK